MNPLKGIHHVTAITSSAQKIYDFFTDILSMKLVKKTVNQDDINTYHLFFADNAGNPGTDMTFFDFKGISKAQKGTDEIAKTGFRVASDEALSYWAKRLNIYEVKHEKIQDFLGRKTIFFEDFDGQEYALFSDEGVPGVAPGIPFENGPVPNEYAIIGLGPIFFRISDKLRIDNVLTNQLKMRLVSEFNNFSLYEMGEGGNGASVIIEVDKDRAIAQQGYGGIHHVAFRIENKAELDGWTDYLNKQRRPNSGFVDRFYFKSLYTRLYPGLLFEFATEGPGFIDEDETLETLGTTLALPPAFKHKRQTIERIVTPLETTKHATPYKKEYLHE